ncbi:hypothetical protein EJB05_52508 [Eragrostis curvula]|uniref:Aminotransferase-like plant mobile domain-containing protein n=1 Tax=Eragrostis curvula TaxID=38414 RepID=A0A5J9SSH7_9POAL|nr:hypothetical protein EJB05_52508 [Eragrostis curvula]
MSRWVEEWAQATTDVIDEPAPYDHSEYQQYLHWYCARTRTCLIRVQDPPQQLVAGSDALYPGHAGMALHMATDLGREIYSEADRMASRLRESQQPGCGIALEEITAAFARLAAKGRRIVEVASFRKVDAAGRGSSVSQRPPRAPSGTAEQFYGGQFYSTPPPRPDEAGGSGWHGPILTPVPGIARFEGTGGQTSRASPVSSGSLFQDTDTHPDVITQAYGAPPFTQETQTQADVAHMEFRQLPRRERGPSDYYTPSAYDRPHGAQGNEEQSPPPLCEFIEYVDTEQTLEDIAHVYHVAQRARRHWLDMEAEERREEERRKMRQEEEERRCKYEAECKQREEAERRRKQEEDRLAHEAREAERERMRERARRARAAGPDAFRKGKYPRCTQ